MINYLKNKRIRLLGIIVVILLCAIAIGMLMSEYYRKKNYEKVAKKLATYKFESIMPNICYIDSDKVIIYDARCVVVYSIEDEEICGYAQYPDTDESFVQGENALGILVSKNGKNVYAYTQQSGNCVLKYSLDVSESKFEKVIEEKVIEEKAIESLIWQPVIYNESVEQTGAIYSIGNIIKYGENGYCYLGLAQEENLNYSHLRLIVNENNVQREYALFK